MKYLPQYGWKAHVLTLASVAPEVPRDDTMMEYIPNGTPVTRIAATDLDIVCNRLKGWHLGPLAWRLRRFVNGMLPPDRWLLLWLPQAYREARRILSKNPIDAIFTSSFPCTTHLVGYLLKKTTGKPWVAEFRDEWSQHPHRSWPKTWQGQIDAWLERQVLLKADKVVAATDAYVAGLASLVPPNMAQKFATITNAFEDDNIAENSRQDKVKFIVAHVGFLYDGLSFLPVLEEILTEKKIPEREIEFRVVGKMEPLRFAPFNLAEFPLAAKVTRYTGWVPHAEALRHMAEATVLLDVLGRHRGTATIAGKTFEYIASGRPILAVVPPEGETARVIKKTETGTVVEPQDRRAIKDTLLDMYVRWKAGVLDIKPNWREIQRYDARILCQRLAQLLDIVSRAL